MSAPVRGILGILLLVLLTGSLALQWTGHYGWTLFVFCPALLGGLGASLQVQNHIKNLSEQVDHGKRQMAASNASGVTTRMGDWRKSRAFRVTMKSQFACRAAAAVTASAKSL